MVASAANDVDADEEQVAEGDLALLHGVRETMRCALCKLPMNTVPIACVGYERSSELAAHADCVLWSNEPYFVSDDHGNQTNMLRGLLEEVKVGRSCDT